MIIQAPPHPPRPTGTSEPRHTIMHNSFPHRSRSSYCHLINARHCVCLATHPCYSSSSSSLRLLSHDLPISLPLIILCLQQVYCLLSTQVFFHVFLVQVPNNVITEFSVSLWSSWINTRCALKNINVYNNQWLGFHASVLQECDPSWSVLASALICTYHFHSHHLPCLLYTFPWSWCLKKISII